MKNKNKLNILLVLEYYHPHIGGVEVVFKALAEGLAARGHQVTVLTQHIGGTKRDERMNGVHIVRLRTLNRYLFSFLAIPKAVWLAKEADIVHTTTYNGAFPARIAAILRRKPSVITVHEVLDGFWGKFLGLSRFNAWLHRMLEKMVLGLGFDSYVCVSHSTGKQLVKHGTRKDKIQVVYNGVDYGFFDPKKHSGNSVRKNLGLSGFVYGFYGRPGGSKGLEHLLRAVPLIKEKILGSKLLAVVSRSPAYKRQYNHMLDLIDSLGIANDVCLVNAVSRAELPSYMMAADCVVVPSLSEGFGFTAAESCALGKVVVASNTTSLPEVVSGKYVLVKPQDPEAIATGVVMAKKGEYAKAALKKFLVDDNVKEYERVYAQIIKS